MTGLKYTVVVTHPDTLTPVALLAGKPVPEWAEDLVQPDDYADEDSADVGDQGYSAFKVDELKAEIGRRNEGREEADKVSLDGKKADLVAALEADDVKAAAGSTE